MFAINRILIILGHKVPLNTTQMAEHKREVKMLLSLLRVQLKVVVIARGLRYDELYYKFFCKLHIERLVYVGFH